MHISHAKGKALVVCYASFGGHKKKKMEIDNRHDYLKFNATYKSNAKIYQETHGGPTFYYYYYYLIQFNENGLFRIRQVFNYNSIENEIRKLSNEPYDENQFYQLDILDIKFEIEEYGANNIFNGKVIENGIVGEYLGMNKSNIEVFELIKK